MILSASVQNAILILKSLNGSHVTLVPAYQIAKDNEISPAFVDQICRKLKNAGFITSNRGPGGGYKQIKEVSVKELIDLLTESKRRCVHSSVFEINSKVNNLLHTIKV